MLCKDGNFLQDLLIEEGVAAVDALSRAAVLELQVLDEKKKDSNGKIHLRVSLLWHQGTAGTESLESFGSFGCARGGSFVLGSGNVKTTVWSMALGFGFLIALQLFSRTQPLQALVVG